MVIIYHMFRSCRTLATNIHTNYPLGPVRIHYPLGAPFGGPFLIYLTFLYKFFTLAQKFAGVRIIVVFLFVYI